MILHPAEERRLVPTYKPDQVYACLAPPAGTLCLCLRNAPTGAEGGVVLAGESAGALE